MTTNDNSETRIEDIIAENKKLRAELLRHKSSQHALHEDIMLGVKSEQETAQLYRKKITSIESCFIDTLELQERLISQLSKNPAYKNLPYLELSQIKACAKSLRTYIDAIVKDKNYFCNADRHLGGLVASIDELIEMCRINVEALNRETGLSLKLKVNASKVNTQLYSVHDFKFVAELFRYMALFFREIYDSKYRSPEIEYSISEGTNPNCYFSDLSFKFWNPDILHPQFQESYDAYYNDENHLPDSWFLINENLRDILVICSKYSVHVKVNQDSFGLTKFSIGRDIFVSDSRSRFDQFMKLREQYTPNKIMFIGKHKEIEERNGTLKLIRAFEKPCTYVPMNDFHPTLLSQTRALFLSSEFTGNEASKVIQETINYPFDKVKIIATNRTDKQIIHHNRVYWYKREIDTFNLEKIVSC